MRDFGGVCPETHHVDDRLLPLKQTVPHTLNPAWTPVGLRAHGISWRLDTPCRDNHRPLGARRRRDRRRGRTDAGAIIPHPARVRTRLTQTRRKRSRSLEGRRGRWILLGSRATIALGETRGGLVSIPAAERGPPLALSVRRYAAYREPDALGSARRLAVRPRNSPPSPRRRSRFRFLRRCCRCRDRRSGCRSRFLL
jgi:hypothetical protein